MPLPHPRWAERKKLKMGGGVGGLVYASAHNVPTMSFWYTKIIKKKKNLLLTERGGGGGGREGGGEVALPPRFGPHVKKKHIGYTSVHHE